MSALAVIADAGVLPVVVIDDAASAPELGAALAAGGLPCVEITLRSEAALAAIAALAAVDGVTVGAGTVLSCEQADAAVAAGARFVVSPGFDAGVVRRCRERGVDVVPGVATATEAMAALREGVQVLKLFPAEPLGGAAAIRALAGPFPGVRFVPTGGIDSERLPAYLREPAVLAVGGSWLAPRALLAQRRFSDIGERAAAAARAVAEVRA